jgi:hypothetical protein
LKKASMGEASALPSSRPPPPLVQPAPDTMRAWQPWLRWLVVIAGAEATLAIARSLAPSVDVDPRVAFLIGFSAVAGSAVATAAAAPPATVRAAGIGLVLAVMLAVLGSPLPGLTGALIVTAALLSGATLIGTAIGRGIEHPGQLVFVAVVSAAADFASVFHPSGPSAAMAQSEVALSLVALPWPMLGTPAIEPMLGAGDVVFTALYLASARRHGLCMTRTVLALLGAYLATALTVLVSERAVPALPLLGLAFVLVHPAARRPRAADRNRGLAVSAVTVAVVAALLLHH